MKLKKSISPSVHHSILNRFASAEDHLLGTQDFVEYCDYEEQEVKVALEILVNNKCICREKVGGVYVYFLYPRVGSMKPNKYHRDIAEKLGRES